MRGECPARRLAAGLNRDQWLVGSYLFVPGLFFNQLFVCESFKAYAGSFQTQQVSYVFHRTIGDLQDAVQVQRLARLMDYRKYRIVAWGMRQPAQFGYDHTLP